MVVKRIRWLAAGLFAAGLLSSCASTRLTGEFREPGYSGGPVKSVLVVAVSDNQESRRSLEEAFVREFRQRGVAAQAALDALGPDTPIAQKTVLQAGKRLGVEAVFVTRLLGLKEEQVYSEPIYYRRVWVQGRYVYVYSPTLTSYAVLGGRYTTYRDYALESTLFSVQTGEPVWSVRSETVEPESTERVVADLAKAVLDGLKKQALLP